MRLWTVQSMEFVEKIKLDGKINFDIDLIPEPSFEPSYYWMGSQMKKRYIFPKNNNTDYPIWAWYIFKGENKRPDLRSMEFSSYSYPSVLLEIEIPDNEILLSDEEWWNYVMTGIMNRWSDEGWERVFDVSGSGDIDSPRFVQACFWELRIDQIIREKVFGKKINR